MAKWPDVINPDQLTRTAIGVLLSFLSATASVHFNFKTVASLPPSTDAEEIVGSLKVITWRPPQNEWEKQVLHGGESSLEKLMVQPAGALSGMDIIRSHGEEVLAANWLPGDAAGSGFRSVWLWDTADFNWFVFQCDPAHFESAGSSEAFLNHSLKWLALPIEVEVRYQPGAPQFLVGFASMIDAELGREYRLFGIRSQSDSYLLLKVGKRSFLQDYPEGAAYVAERFPPLRERIAKWSKEEVLAEVGKMWSKGRAYANNNSRDAILISAAADRGLSDVDLGMLLQPPGVPSVRAWDQRARTVMTALARTHQIDSHQEVIEKLTLELGRREEVGEFTLHTIFAQLARSSKHDFVSLSLECLRTCIYPDGALWYLSDRGNSEEAYTRVKELAVRPNARVMQQLALKQIGDRIGHR